MDWELLINKDSVNSKIFLDYILDNGFYPEQYNTIWEFNGSARESISQFLADYNPYLISKKVLQADIKELGIRGATGFLNEDGIVIKDRFDNKNRLLYSGIKGIYYDHSYEYPQVSKNDVIIANGINTYMDNLINFNQDKFIGYCMDSDNPDLVYSFNRYKNLFNALNRNIYGTEYILEQDTYNNDAKSLLLIRKKKH